MLDHIQQLRFIIGIYGIRWILSYHWLKLLKKILVEQSISKGDVKLPIKLITFRLVVISSLKNIHSLFKKKQKLSNEYKYITYW